MKLVFREEGSVAGDVVGMAVREENRDWGEPRLLDPLHNRAGLKAGVDDEAFPGAGAADDVAIFRKRGRLDPGHGEGARGRKRHQIDRGHERATGAKKGAVKRSAEGALGDLEGGPSARSPA